MDVGSRNGDRPPPPGARTTGSAGLAAAHSGALAGGIGAVQAAGPGDALATSPGAAGPAGIRGMGGGDGGGGGKPPNPREDFGLALNAFRGQNAIVGGRTIARCLGAAFRDRYVEGNSNLINLARRAYAVAVSTRTTLPTTDPEKAAGTAVMLLLVRQDRELRDSIKELISALVGSDDRAKVLLAPRSHWTEHFVFSTSEGLAPRVMNAALNAGGGSSCLSRDIVEDNIDGCYVQLQSSVDARDRFLKEIEAMQAQVRERGKAAIDRLDSKNGKDKKKKGKPSPRELLESELHEYEAALGTATKNIGGLVWLDEGKALGMAQSFEQAKEQLLESEEAFVNSPAFARLKEEDQDRLLSALADLNLALEVAATAWSQLLAEADSHPRIRKFIEAHHASQAVALKVTSTADILFPNGTIPGTNPPGSQSFREVDRSQCDGTARPEKPPKKETSPGNGSARP